MQTLSRDVRLLVEYHAEHLAIDAQIRDMEAREGIIKQKAAAVERRVRASLKASGKGGAAVTVRHGDRDWVVLHSAGSGLRISEIPPITSPLFAVPPVADAVTAIDPDDDEDDEPGPVSQGPEDGDARDPVVQAAIDAFNSIPMGISGTSGHGQSIHNTSTRDGRPLRAITVPTESLDSPVGFELPERYLDDVGGTSPDVSDVLDVQGDVKADVRAEAMKSLASIVAGLSSGDRITEAAAFAAISLDDDMLDRLMGIDSDSIDLFAPGFSEFDTVVDPDEVLESGETVAAGAVR